jgi:putative transposase
MVHGSTGTGHLYQGRFKSFPVQTDRHFLTVCRYVERNPLRTDLVQRLEDWRWSSFWRREAGRDSMLSAWPVPVPYGWAEYVREPQTEAELDAIRTSVRRNAPFGEETWRDETIRRLGIAPVAPRGRPRKMGPVPIFQNGIRGLA